MPEMRTLLPWCDQIFRLRSANRKRLHTSAPAMRRAGTSFVKLTAVKRIFKQLREYEFHMRR
jgi:hypothetical protein